MRLIVALLCSCFAFGVQAQEVKTKLGPEALAVWNDAKGPFAPAIFRHATKFIIDCYDFDAGEERKCSLASVAIGVEIFEETHPDMPQWALTVISHASSGGNAMSHEIAVFGRNGSAEPHHIVDVTELYGHVAWAGFDSSVVGQPSFLVATHTLMPGDARCCPAGITIWRVPVDTGKASIIAGNGYR